MGDLNSNYVAWYTVLRYLSEGGIVAVPESYHDKCRVVKSMLDSDSSGMINSIMSYAVNEASDVKYSISCSSKALEEKLNTWLQEINIQHLGDIPLGVSELSREYYKERWLGSSLCILRIAWGEVNGFILPTSIWLMDGSGIYIRKSTKSTTIGGYEYFLDAQYTVPLTGEYIINKPFDRWYAGYPTPYLIKNGVYRNFYGLQFLKEKGEQTVKKLLPYLLILKKGTEGLYKQGVRYDDQDMTELHNNFEEFLEQYKTQETATPTYTTPFDFELNHNIPDIRNIMSADLYSESNRAILSGLGFVEISDGVTTSRKESVLNPKPFISEVDSGVNSFKGLLEEIIKLTVIQNKSKHRNLFKDASSIKLNRTALKIREAEIIEMLKTLYDRGAMSITTYQEKFGLDPELEKKRREFEEKKGLNDTFAPHPIMLEPTGVPAPKEKTKDPEAENKSGTDAIDYVNAEEKEEESHKALMMPFATMEDLPDNVKELPEYQQSIWMKTFNFVYEKTIDEDMALRNAWQKVKETQEEEKKLWETKE